MARPTLMAHRKFRRLCRLSGRARYQCRGFLELLWDSANESGEPIAGDSLDVELTIEWDGQEGKGAAFLEQAGFIDTLGDGRFEIHHFWDHAPEYVRRRRKRELERRISGERLVTDQPLTGQRLVTDQPMTVTDEKMASVVDTPAPAPAPAPAPRSESCSTGSNGTVAIVNILGGQLAALIPKPTIEEEFVRWWAEYPKKTGRKKALQRWKAIPASKRPSADQTLAFIEAAQQTDRWLDGYIKGGDVFVGDRTWEDDLEAYRDKTNDGRREIPRPGPKIRLWKPPEDETPWT